MMANHGDAATRRGHDVIIRGKDAQEPLGERTGVAVQAGVRHRLAATGLCLGKIDLNAEALQHLDRCQSNVWIELVDVAGDEQADAHFCHLVLLSLVSAPVRCDASH